MHIFYIYTNKINNNCLTLLKGPEESKTSDGIQ